MNRKTKQKKGNYEFYFIYTPENGKFKKKIRGRKKRNSKAWSTAKMHASFMKKKLRKKKKCVESLPFNVAKQNKVEIDARCRFDNKTILSEFQREEKFAVDETFSCH